ncbi:MAG: autotransporter-associated beta strand repeat-containing protein [Akkermansiaceae bacterium]
MKSTDHPHLHALAGIAFTLSVAVTADAQELITNGDFSATPDLSDWTQASWAGGSSFGLNANGPTDTSTASGNYAYAGGGTYNLLQQNVAVTTGSAYRLTFLAGSKAGDGSTFGNLSLRQEALDNYNSAGFDYRPSDAAFGSYTVDFVADTSTVGVWLRNDLGGYAAYDNVSVTPIGGVTHALNYSAASGFTEITSALTGSGKVTTNAGAGGLSLTGSNSYTGGTEVTGGTLYVTGSATLGDAGGTVTVSGSGVLDVRNAQTRTGVITMTGQDARIISTDGGGSIVNNGGAFQFGGGQLQVPISGTGGLNVTGGGSITSANSYTGPTTISATAGWYETNTFFVDNAAALGDAAADLTITGGIVSLANNTITRTGAVAITGGGVYTGTLSKDSGVYDIQGGQIDAVLAGDAGLTKSGSGDASLTGSNTYTGATTVSAGTLLVTGALTSDVSIGANASLGGGGTVGALTFAQDSFFDVFMAIGGNPMDSTGTISFSGIGFGIDNLLSAGSVIDWSTIDGGIYTLVSGTLDSTNLDNFGLANAYNLGGGRQAYFQNGSLQLVVIPEPRVALLGGLGMLALLRRRRD